MIKYVLFDFDGTLMDTNECVIASWQHTYEHYLGHKVDVEKITSCFGEPLLITMAREFPQVKPQDAADVYRTFQKEHCLHLIKIFPGIEELLKTLKEEGYILGVVTSRTRVSAEQYMGKFGIEKYFDNMICCEDTTSHKPNPEPIFACLEKLEGKTDEAIMVGDSAFDIICANNAGVKSVLVGWHEKGTDEKDSEGLFDYTIETPMDLINILHENQ